MATPDLRDWIARLREMDQIQDIDGADCGEEIGGIVDIFQRHTGNKAVLFDNIPGFKPGFRVIANLMMSVSRLNLTLGLPVDSSEMDLVRYWRSYFQEAKYIPPTTLETGPIFENVFRGDAVDIGSIPTPKWHEHDGGPYIGTGCMVIMKDPESGWINYGAYRVQSHGPQLATVMASKGKHGNLIMRKYHERGEPCPVAVVVGMHPALLTVAGMEIPYGKNEYDAAGGMMREPIEIVAGPETGLPIPANAEIAFEGTITAGDLVQEGPLGEWTGYYASGSSPEPALRITSLMYRNDPILTGAIPAVPPNDNTFFKGAARSGAVWNQIEAAGVPGIQGVWAHDAGGSRFWLTVSIKQMYAGHSKQAGLIASQCHAGAYANRFVVVVDDDIDPTNMDEVVWAMCTRVSAHEDIDIIKNCWSTGLDPMAYPEDNRVFNSRAVIDACKPWLRKDTFPIRARSSAELDKRIIGKFGKYLPL